MKRDRKNGELLQMISDLSNVLRKKNEEIKEITKLYKQQDECITLYKMRVEQLEEIIEKDNHLRIKGKINRGELGKVVTIVPPYSVPDGEVIWGDSKAYWRKHGIIF